MPRPMTKAELKRRIDEAGSLSGNQFAVLGLKIDAIVEYLSRLPGK